MIESTTCKATKTNYLTYGLVQATSLSRLTFVQMTRLFMKLHQDYSLVMDRTFKVMLCLLQDAVKNLNSLQTNAQVLEQIRRTKGRLARNNLPEMISFTERAGVTVKLFFIALKLTALIVFKYI